VKRALKKVRNRVFAALHPGDARYCVYCGKTSGKFLHEGVKAEVFRRERISGGGYKTDTRCPHCGSVDRSRLLNLFFTLRTDVLRKQTRILHVSPNHDLARFLARHPSVRQVCGSIEPEEYAEFASIFLDVQKMGLGDAEFDVVICCHVLEHVPDDASAMREIHRVLRPGGFAILQVPLALSLETTLEDSSVTTRKQRKITFGQGDHLRLYGLDYFERLRRAGFRTARDHPFDQRWLDERELRRHRLDPLEDVVIGYKD
jgi:SAM-dependent methyltransferase